MASHECVQTGEVKEKHMTIRRTGLVYDERMLKHLNEFNPNHPECPERIGRAWHDIQSSGLLQRCIHVEAREATKEEILLVHDEEHYELLSTSLGLSQEDLLALSGCYSSIYLNSHSFQVGKLCAGSVIELTQQALDGKVDNGFALVRPPGHHAECTYAMGFCLFNSIAIATKHAVDKLGVERVLIVDWDVHHGNGTQNIFYNDKRILYTSLHRYDYGMYYPCREDANYTFTGGDNAEGYNVNIAWNRDKMGDPEYLAAFHHIIMPIAYEFQPELVVVSCGFDAAEGDPLGGYSVTPGGYAHMTHMLMSLAAGKLVFVLEGGYNLSSISNSVQQILLTLQGDFPLPIPPCGSPCESAMRSIRDTGRAHSEYWKSMKVFAELAVEKSPPPLTPPEVTEPQIGRGGPWNDIEEVKRKLQSSTTESPMEVTNEKSEKPMEEVKKKSEDQVEAARVDTDTSSGACGSVVKDTITKDEIFGVMEELGHTKLFAVTPLPWCNHLSTNVKPLPEAGIDASVVCEMCSVKQEPWVCLTCYHVFCGRYVNGHMVEHHDQSGHSVVLSLADISVWCFNCDSYMDNRALDPAKNSAHLSKFGVKRPGPS